MCALILQLVVATAYSYVSSLLLLARWSLDWTRFCVFGPAS